MRVRALMISIHAGVGFHPKRAGFESFPKRAEVMKEILPGREAGKTKKAGRCTVSPVKHQYEASAAA